MPVGRVPLTTTSMRLKYEIKAEFYFCCMKVDKQLVDRLANLAKLEFDEDREKQIISDLNKMIEFIDKLKEVKVEGVEPLIYLSEEVNIFREDQPSIDITKEEALKNAPLADSDYFKVPKVIKSRK